MGECRFCLRVKGRHIISPSGSGFCQTGQQVRSSRSANQQDNHKKEVIELRLPFTRRRRVDRNYRRARNYEWERGVQAFRLLLVFLLLSFALGLAFSNAWHQ